MHPVMHHLVALTSHGLGYLALVMGEHQVHAATMYIEVLAQVFAPHGRAFAVPTGEAVAPVARPSHDMFGLGGLPEGEVGLVTLLVGSCQVAAVVDDVGKVTPREDAVPMVFIIFLDVEIYRAVALVGIAIVE